jgi:hypothetical protein
MGQQVSMREMTVPGDPAGGLLSFKIKIKTTIAQGADL